MCTVVKKRWCSAASGQEKEAAKQIFTSSAASGILTNDLVKIMESEQVKKSYKNKILNRFSQRLGNLKMKMTVTES